MKHKKRSHQEDIPIPQESGELGLGLVWVEGGDGMDGKSICHTVILKKGIWGRGRKSDLVK